MNMAQMGYVIIDRQGRIRVRKVDRQFGEHAQDIIRNSRTWRFTPRYCIAMSF
jgi:hypothetical protein